MPVTLVQSKWSSGNLIFHDKGDYGVGAEILKIAQAGVTIGTSTNSATLSVSGLLTSTSPTGFRSNPTFVPDSTRTNYAFAIGWGHTDTDELDVTMGSGSNQHFDPFQMNINIIGADPANLSTTNLMYGRLIHDTTAMPNLRLKHTDWYTEIGVNVKNVYIIQGEIKFTAASITAGGEVAVIGLVLDAGADAVTCTVWRGLNITMRGAGTPANASGLFVRVEESTTIAEGIRLMAWGTMTTGLRFGNISGGECPSHIYSVPAAGTGVTTSGADASGDVEGSLAIQVGNVTKFLHYWPNVAS